MIFSALLCIPTSTDFASTRSMSSITPASPPSLYHIRLSQSPLSTLSFDFDFGQWPRDGPLVGHCSVCSFSAMTTSWGPAGVCGVDFWSIHARSMKGQHCQHPRDPFVCGCVWWGGLVIFMRQHVCWLMTGGLCEGPSLQKAVCSAASTFVFYSSSVQLPQMMSRCNCDVFIHANGTAPRTTVSAGGLAYAFC